MLHIVYYTLIIRLVYQYIDDKLFFIAYRILFSFIK
nr:MAG TPA: hypothetical protein [Bacteriophage sp.]